MWKEMTESHKNSQTCEKEVTKSKKSEKENKNSNK